MSGRHPYLEPCRPLHSTNELEEGMKLPINEARERAFSKLSRLMISGHDFQQALSATTYLLEEVDGSVNSGLAELRRFRCCETTMVIAYRFLSWP